MDIIKTINVTNVEVLQYFMRKKIPIDIIINHIIPYTYNIQPRLLLEDINNYHKIKTILIDDKYNTDIIKHEINVFTYLNN